MNNYLLLAPGPVNLHPQVRQVLSEPMLHHRTPLFDQTLQRVLAKLPQVFGTSQRVFLQSSTGTGGMETLMVNTCNPGEEILVINSGKFGERWAEMGRRLGLIVHEHKVPWGQAVDPSAVDQILFLNSQIRSVFCQACETSTGVQHPLEELGHLISKRDSVLFLVDGITAVGAYPVPMDEWKIDGLVAGSQKAFMLPTGMAFYSFSAKAWRRIPEVKMPRYYFDVRDELQANLKGETWFSSNVSLIRALDIVLQMIFEKGLDQHYKEIQERANFCRWAIDKLGFSLFPKVPSDSLTAFLLPQGVDSQKLRTQLEKEFNVTVMGGQDQLKGLILRVGHMGFIQKDDLLRFFRDFQSLLQNQSITYNPLSDREMISWFQS